MTGVSAKGRPKDGILTWRMGATPPPPALDGPWDVVVHAAATTRWTQTPTEASVGNIGPAEALAAVVSERTHVIFLSTSHVVGTAGDPWSPAVDDFRNAYEWAKGRAERHVLDHLGPATILRFPMVIGRRSDGAVTRFSGFYQVLNGLTSGLLPAFVGVADAPVDLVPVDDIADEVVARIVADRPSATVIDTMGRGGDAAHDRHRHQHGLRHAQRVALRPGCPAAGPGTPARTRALAPLLPAVCSPAPVPPPDARRRSVLRDPSLPVDGRALCRDREGRRPNRRLPPLARPLGRTQPARRHGRAYAVVVSHVPVPERCPMINDEASSLAIGHLILVSEQPSDI